jgi:CO/xanthine dehydrogenase FAD-binding subunit
MSAFECVCADGPAAAVETVSTGPRAACLAGGTTQLDLILKDGVISPERLVDVGLLPSRDRRGRRFTRDRQHRLPLHPAAHQIAAGSAHQGRTV